MIALTVFAGLVIDDVIDLHNDPIEEIIKGIYHLVDAIIIGCYIYQYFQIMRLYDKIKSGKIVRDSIQNKMKGNIGSLKILFLSICLVNILRITQYIYELNTSEKDAEVFDIFILIAKTVMIFGIFFSIYMRI
jgi:hypothetical protein